VIKTINSWGNNFRADINCLNKLPEDKSKILIFGNNNSYGDASIPLESQTVNVENLNRDMYYLSPLINLDKYMYEHKNMLYGIPGKNNVTLGGAVASDVHGKDGIWGGSFIENIYEVSLILPNGDKVICSENKNKELFEATCGGFGLTGAIVGLKLKQSPLIYSSNYQVVSKKGHGLNKLLSSFPELENQYAVAWVDLLSESYKWVIEISQPISSISKKEIFKEYASKELNISVPFIGDNKFKSMKRVNSTYFFLKNNRDKVKNFKDTFYPLGFFSNTKNIVKNRKIVQIQFSIAAAYETKLLELLELLIYKQSPILCSVKRISTKKKRVNLSFIQNGWTVAVDFPEYNFDHMSIRKFYTKLIEMEGKIYLAKDSTLLASEFKAMYTEHEKWKTVVKKVDPLNMYQSKMSHRLDLKEW
jgi:decaprenylphospho-beta-D-ribofuranose 2-oxidase